jgi:hypothetical protein
MGRLAAAIFIALVALVFTEASAPADSDGVLNRHVTGPFTATSGVAPDDDCGLSNLRDVIDGTYVTEKGGTGSFGIVVCIDPDDDVFNPPAEGTFALTTPHGAALTGPATGSYAVTIGCGPFPFPPCLVATSFTFTLSPATGTKAFQRATGSILAQGSLTTSPISGTLAGLLTK